jgi:hypothetical protein
MVVGHQAGDVGVQAGQFGEAASMALSCSPPQLSSARVRAVPRLQAGVVPRHVLRARGTLTAKYASLASFARSV